MKFFRKIRYDLIRKSNTGKYFKYAIGEILLVVVGILIALQINNWNQARKDDKVLKEYLVKIKNHTLEDLRILDTLSKYRTQLANQCKKARTRILDKTETRPFSVYVLWCCLCRLLFKLTLVVMSR